MIQQSFNSILNSLLGSALVKGQRAQLAEEEKQTAAAERQADVAEGNVETLYTEEGEGHLVRKGTRAIGGTSEQDPIRHLYTAQELAQMEVQKAETQAYHEGQEAAYGEMETAWRRGFRGEESAFGGPLYNEVEARLRGSTDKLTRAQFASATRRYEHETSRIQREISKQERAKAKEIRAERRKK